MLNLEMQILEIEIFYVAIRVQSVICTENHFKAIFTVAKKSEYREECRNDIYQKRALQVVIGYDRMRPDEEPAYDAMILRDNPCHVSGVFFTGIDIFCRFDNEIVCYYYDL